MKKLLNFIKSFRLYFQSSNLGGNDFGFKFKWGNRRMLFFHDYMGCHNLSEGHERKDCRDTAYCEWHGSL